ncbi:hypothetical protein [Desulfovibrio litoralis]|uniref:Uncharacterized protein n=1 Tax=Desulfovibrio litoralis DSM 11393 TaxID=1121455 RepID=A0A1M7T7I1_9BACT|nr:hypothetical protein [Desulfovibrio litoralis]SHN66668.1 hypothetical protein SAMN02745728_01672 [Desulfovibrio litoralis DSM 11393]
MSGEMTFIKATILKITDEAMLVDCCGVEEWLPLSQIDFIGIEGEITTIELPEWLYDQKGFIKHGFEKETETQKQATEPLEEAPETTEAKPFKHDAHFLRSETITVTQDLNDTEKLEYGQEMAEALSNISRLESELDGIRKQFKRQIEGHETNAKSASRLYLTGKEEREIFCDLVADFNTNEMVWTDANPPHDIVKRRPMTDEEKCMQIPLPLNKKTNTPPPPQEILAITAVSESEEAKTDNDENNEEVHDADFTEIPMNDDLAGQSPDDDQPIQ